jgi:hypothetical protein
MGKGKGAPEGWVAVVKPGRILFEMSGVAEDLAKEAMRLAAHKLPIATRFVTRAQSEAEEAEEIRVAEEKGAAKKAAVVTAATAEKVVAPKAPKVVAASKTVQAVAEAALAEDATLPETPAPAVVEAPKAAATEAATDETEESNG